MRRIQILSCLLMLLGTVDSAFAQAAPKKPASEQPDEPDAEPPTKAEPSGPGRLIPPDLQPIELPPATNLEPAPRLPDAKESKRGVSPAPRAPEQKRGWTAPESVLQLHGYMRMRGTLLRRGYLNHGDGSDRLALPGRTNYDPFRAFLPSDRTPKRDQQGKVASDPPVQNGCGDKAGGDGRCSSKNQAGADLRLRLKPEIHLSDDVRVKAWVDLLDNVGAGSLGYGPNAPSVANTIRVRRAWAEARNRDLGELRFGRMGADWGLGILDNGGDRYGIDSDFSSDVDRIMGITNLAGFYLMAAYDWASEGDVRPGVGTPSGVVIDSAQNDDLHVYTLAAARRMDESAQQSALLRGGAVFNYGAYFVYRNQLLQAYSAEVPAGTPEPGFAYTRLNQTQYIPDIWAQLRWQGLRLELEAAYILGSLEGGCPKLDLSAATDEVGEITAVGGQDGRASSGTCKFNQIGAALELEYRLFDERLGLYLYGGYASGDRQAYGLAATNSPALQRVDSASAVGNRTISTYQFHPDYRVDLILWRTLMQRVAGAYYVKPGVGYDFIRDPYGQVAGGRIDVIYSRASQPDQTWGGNASLGLEMDLSVYYRSEDGPDPMDGFYALAQWGVLFPMQGLNLGGNEASSAMVFRAVAGVAY